MKKFEKALKNEIKKSARTDYSLIRERCGIKPDNLKNRELKMVLADGNEVAASSSKRNIIFVSLVAIITIIVSLYIIISKIPSNSYQPSKGYFIIDINPSIEICYDENGVVTQVNPLNEDAEVLLLSLDFSEKHYTDAVKKIVDSCIELGYISPDRADNAIMTTAVSEDGFKDDYMTNEIKKAFSSEFSNRKIPGVVITGVESPELKNEAQRFGIDAQKYALIKEYLGVGGELAEQEYGEISIRELYKGIYEKEKEAKKQLIDELIEKEKQNKINSIESVKSIANKIADQINKKLEHIPEWEEGFYIEILSQIETLILELEDLETIEEISEKLEVLKGIVGDGKHNIHVEFDIVDKAINDFKSSSQSLKEANKKPEEKREELLNEFGEIKEGSADVNIEDWQKEFENQFSSSWYEYKDKWKNDRENSPNIKP